MVFWIYSDRGFTKCGSSVIIRAKHTFEYCTFYILNISLKTDLFKERFSHKFFFSILTQSFRKELHLKKSLNIELKTSLESFKIGVYSAYFYLLQRLGKE
jgi:hypothetical protein